MDYCQFLTASMKYEDEEGYHYWEEDIAPFRGMDPTGKTQCGRCTSGAMVIADHFGGRVMGYRYHPHMMNQELIGEAAGGHDFAIVDEFLVDWWGWDYEQSLKEPVLHLVNDAALISRKFLPRELWKPMKMWRCTGPHVKASSWQVVTMK